MKNAPKQEPHTLTGPDTDVVCPSLGAAISKGMTRAARHPEPCTFYVRDADGNGVRVIERNENRQIINYAPSATFTPGA